MSTSMLCRVCVSEQSELVNMLNLYYGSTPATTFIMDILQIKVDSEGSSALVMCSSCNTTLNNFYSFYNMVRDAQHKYKQTKFKYVENEHIIDVADLIKIEMGEADENVNEEYSLENISSFEINKTTQYKNYKSLNVDISSGRLEMTLTNNKCCTDVKPFMGKMEEVKNEYIISSATNEQLHSVDYINTPSTSNLSNKVQDGRNNRRSSHPIDSQPTECGDAGDEETDSASADNNAVTSSKKTCVIISTKDIEITSDKTLKAEQRILEATKAVLEKYKIEEIYRNRKWHLSQKEKDEIFKLYIDMKCSACAIELSTYNELDDHCMAEHGTNAVVMCCEKEFVEYKPMEYHILYNHILSRKAPAIRRQIPCKVCNKLINKCRMVEHLAKHLPPEMREFQCDQCDAGFAKQANLKAHIKRRHSISSVPCPECGKVCKNALSLSNHQRNRHSTSSNESFLCPECGKTIKNLYNYKNHMKEHQGIMERVKCHLCGIIVKKFCITRHLRSHDSKNIKQCPHCPYKAFSIWQHVKLVHKKIKRFTCSYCPMTFCDPNPMQDHVASRHTGIPRYSCQFCDKTFMSSGNFHSHRKRMHPEQWTEVKQKKAEKKNEDNVLDYDTLKEKKKKRGIIAEDDRVVQMIQDMKTTTSKITPKSPP